MGGVLTWTSLLFRSFDPNRPLDARSILFRGIWDYSATGVLFVLLSGVTVLLRLAADWNKDSETHYKVLVWVEHAVFYVGNLIIVLVVLYLLVVLAWDLWRSLRRTLAESPPSAAPTTTIPATEHEAPGAVTDPKQQSSS